MIDYPIDIDEFETSEYDPFLHHVVRHKLRKKKKRRGLRRLMGNYPKNRILLSVGIGRRRRRTRPVRRAIGRPVRHAIRTLDKRYRGPFRNRMVSRSGAIKKRFRMPLAKFGNPIHRDLKGNKGISKTGMRKPGRRGRPIMSGDPSKRNNHPVFVINKRQKPKVSKDIVIPYKRRYGSGKGRARPMPKRISKETMLPVEEELPVTERDMITKGVEIMEKKKKEEKPQVEKNKRKMRNIIGVAVLGLAIAGFVMYKMKTKIEVNGRNS